MKQSIGKMFLCSLISTNILYTCSRNYFKWYRNWS